MLRHCQQAVILEVNPYAVRYDAFHDFRNYREQGNWSIVCSIGTAPALVDWGNYSLLPVDWYLALA